MKLWLSDRVMELKCEIMLVLLRISAIREILLKWYKVNIFRDRHGYTIYAGDNIVACIPAMSNKEAEYIASMICASEIIGG